MEIKILDSILHGELKPWKLDTSGNKRFTELVKTAKAVSPTNNTELQKQLTTLLSDYPTLRKWLSTETTSSTSLQPLICSIDLPACSSPLTHFYAAVITAETLRVYNSFMLQSVNWNTSIDIPFQTNRLLNSLKVLTQQTVAELKERNFTTVPDEQSDINHFALYYLKHSLIQLYFSIQRVFENSLSQVTTLEDFYSLDLEEPVSAVPKLDYTITAGEKGPVKKSKSQKLTFGFNGKKEKLTTVINNLCSQIELLKEDVSPADMLIKLLLSHDIKPGNVQIHLDCDNKNFRYVIEKFAPYFNSLSFINIEHSKSFYSKKGTLLKANNFSKARSFDPKAKADIDNIFKQMQ
jgi:hypothetical protein